MWSKYLKCLVHLRYLGLDARCILWWHEVRCIQDKETEGQTRGGLGKVEDMRVLKNYRGILFLGFHF